MLRWCKTCLAPERILRPYHPPRTRLTMHPAPSPVSPAIMASHVRLVRVDSDTPAGSDTPPPDASSVGESPEVVLVKSGFRHLAIRTREIVFVEAARNYVHIHLESGAVLKSRVPIDRLAAHLGSARFLRIHRGRIVSVDRIRAVAPVPGGRLRITLLHGATIEVARDRRRSVLAELTALAT